MSAKTGQAALYISSHETGADYFQEKGLTPLMEIKMDALKAGGRDAWIKEETVDDCPMPSDTEMLDWIKGIFYYRDDLPDGEVDAGVTEDGDKLSALSTALMENKGDFRLALKQAVLTKI